MDSVATKEMLESYSWAILLEGAPPGRDFHRKLLRMEKRAFLAGFHKAFVLGAGPCPVCERCPEDGLCRYPDQARPSMEGSGIDVYSTASGAGIHLKPVTDKDQYVKYIGLLLLG
jgi:predicted metal-binding protein